MTWSNCCAREVSGDRNNSELRIVLNFCTSHEQFTFATLLERVVHRGIHQEFTAVGKRSTAEDPDLPVKSTSPTTVSGGTSTVYLQHAYQHVQ